MLLLLFCPGVSYLKAVLRRDDILLRIRIRGPMPRTNGSGQDSDPDPAIFIIHLQDANKKIYFFKKKFVCLFFFEGTFTLFYHFSNIKSQKEVTKHLLFFLSGAGSVPVSLTKGSGCGSRRPKNIWIRRIRTRIRNAA
jgi:hypothetical protein